MKTKNQKQKEMPTNRRKKTFVISSKSDIAIINDFNRIKKASPDRTIYMKDIDSSSIGEYTETTDYNGRIRTMIFKKVFIECTFTKVDFNDLVISDCYFNKCTFITCKFNCTMASCIMDRHCRFTRCNTANLNLTVRISENLNCDVLEYKNSYLNIANKRKYFYMPHNARKKLNGYKLFVFDIDYNMDNTAEKRYLNIMKKIKSFGINEMYIYTKVELDQSTKQKHTIYGSLTKAEKLKVISVEIPPIYLDILGSAIKYKDLYTLVCEYGRLTLFDYEDIYTDSCKQFVSKRYNNTDTVYSYVNDNPLDRYNGLSFYSNKREMVQEFTKNIQPLLDDSLIH